jgi:hypothetical protein
MRKLRIRVFCTQKTNIDTFQMARIMCENAENCRGGQVTVPHHEPVALMPGGRLVAKAGDTRDELPLRHARRFYRVLNYQPPFICF